MFMYEWLKAAKADDKMCEIIENMSPIKFKQTLVCQLT